MTETELPIYHDCNKIKKDFEPDEIELKVAELVADKYIDLYKPTGIEVEDVSHKFWLQRWADLLANDSIRQKYVLMQLDKFGRGRIIPERVDWDE